MNTTRKYWLNTLIKISSPVIMAMAEGRLKASMPVEINTDKSSGPYAYNDQVTHLEALGRTLSGISPWLETPSSDPEEEKMRVRMAALSRAAISNAVDPESADYCNFTSELTRQPLVDAGFLSHAIIRAPHELWGKLDEKSKINLVNALRQTREILPWQSNWLLFSAMVETALYIMTGELDQTRVDHAINMHEEWYKGDGIYGDGDTFHFDYYNSYVIQPMLLDILRTLKPYLGQKICTDQAMETYIKRSQRYAEIQERLIAPDGTFPVVGRSIAYRTGAFQLLAQLALWDKLPDSLSPAQVRCALTSVIKKCFDNEDNFDENGWLAIGLYGHQPSLAESYISTGSLYLCTTGFLSLGLPAEHSFWADDDQLYTAQKVWSGIDIKRDQYLK